MRKYTLYFDLDDVGNQLCRFLFNCYNQDYQDRFHWLNSETFMLAENKGLKATNDYFKEVLHREGTFLNLEPAEGFVEILQRFIENGYDVRILTHPQWTSDYCMTEKMKWIQNHLPFFNLDHVIMTRLKGEVAKENRILLDDNPEHLRAWEENGGIGVAYAKIAYSQKWTGKQVINFEEFYAFVESLENE